MFPGGRARNASAAFDPTNAMAFFTAARARGDAIWGVELGNELGPDSKTMTAAEQGAGLLVLDAALAELYGDAQRPVLVGPDALGFHTPAPPAAATGSGSGASSAFVPSADILAYMTDFVTAVGPRLHAGASLWHGRAAVPFTPLTPPFFQFPPPHSHASRVHRNK